MGRKYVTIKCSCCHSTSQIKRNGFMTDTFLCPVCLDGEIEYRVERPRVYRDESEFPLDECTLMAIKAH